MVHVFVQKIGKTKLSSKQLKQDDTHTKSVKINAATTIKIVDQKIAQNTPVIKLKTNREPRER
jgi:hypothetical protein